MLREIPGASLYFGSYYYLKEKKVNTLVAGGCAGVISWIPTYPLDVIKSRVQQGTPFLKAFHGNYWKGIEHCLLRALFANAVFFYCYEYLQKIS